MKLMRTLAAVTAGLVLATIGPVASAAPASPSLPDNCYMNVAALSATGSTSHSITVASPPRDGTFPASSLGDFITPDVVAADGASSFISGGIVGGDYHGLLAVHRNGRVYDHQSRYHSEEGTSFDARLVARGLPPVRSLAQGGGSSFYTLDAGTLRRFTTTATSTRQTGTRTGFSIYRGLTLLRAYPDRDVLAATTTRGALMIIEVRHAGTFAPRHSVVRASGWGSIDRLAATECGTTTALLSVDGRTGRAQVHTILPLARTTTATPIRSLGDLPDPIREPFVMTVATGW